MKKKVYIFTVTAGAGHVKAGEALFKMFSQNYPDWDLEIFDVLEYTNFLFKRRYSKSYVQIVQRMPELWGILYDKTDDPKIANKIAGIRNFFNSINASKLIKFIKKSPPDLVICTHFLPADILSSMKKAGEIKFPWACVVTDFEVHRFWMYENADLYVVPTNLAKFQLERNGIRPSNIKVFGIPIDSVFSQQKDKKEILNKMKLKESIRTILIMSGGFGMGPVENIVDSIDKINLPVQLIIVAGKNKLLENKLNNKTYKKTVKILGFVNYVDELLAVSDLIVSKPGGLTTSESLATGTPMIIINPIPGQESRNSDYLLENGAAISVASVEDIGYRIKSILNEEGKLEKMQQNARDISKPFAAKDILEEIMKRWF